MISIFFPSRMDRLSFCVNFSFSLSFYCFFFGMGVRAWVGVFCGFKNAQS